MDEQVRLLHDILFDDCRHRSRKWHVVSRETISTARLWCPFQKGSLRGWHKASRQKYSPNGVEPEKRLYSRRTKGHRVRNAQEGRGSQ
jgi:hypothetical protein